MVYLKIEETGQGLFRFPSNCKINVSTKLLVELAYKTLEEATNSSFRWYSNNKKRSFYFS
jgi:hypothetical protein